MEGSSLRHVQIAESTARLISGLGLAIRPRKDRERVIEYSKPLSLSNSGPLNGQFQKGDGGHSALRIIYLHLHLYVLDDRAARLMSCIIFR